MSEPSSDSDDDGSDEAEEPSPLSPPSPLPVSTVGDAVKPVGILKSRSDQEPSDSSDESSSSSSSSSSDEDEEPADMSPSKQNPYPITDIRRWMRPGFIWEYLDSHKPGEEDAGKTGGSSDSINNAQQRAVDYEKEQRAMYEGLDEAAFEGSRKRAVKHPFFREFMYDLVGDDRELQKQFVDEFGTIEPVEEMVAFASFVWSKMEASTTDPKDEDQKKEDEE